MKNNRAHFLLSVCSVGGNTQSLCQQDENQLLFLSQNMGLIGLTQGSAAARRRHSGQVSINKAKPRSCSSRWWLSDPVRDPLMSGHLIRRRRAFTCFHHPQIGKVVIGFSTRDVSRRETTFCSRVVRSRPRPVFFGTKWKKCLICVFISVSSMTANKRRQSSPRLGSCSV